MTKSEQICKALGIEWHTEEIKFNGFNRSVCSCHSSFEDNWSLAIHIRESNPNFEGEKNDAGRVQLLRLMMEREDWQRFAAEAEVGVIFYRGDGGEEEMEAFVSVDVDFLFKDGPLVDAVIEWFKQIKNTPTRKQLQEVAEKALEGWAGRMRK